MELFFRFPLLWRGRVGSSAFSRHAVTISWSEIPNLMPYHFRPIICPQGRVGGGGSRVVEPGAPWVRRNPRHSFHAHTHAPRKTKHWQVSLAIFCICLQLRWITFWTMKHPRMTRSEHSLLSFQKTTIEQTAPLTVSISENLFVTFAWERQLQHL